MAHQEETFFTRGLLQTYDVKSGVAVVKHTQATPYIIIIYAGYTMSARAMRVDIINSNKKMQVHKYTRKHNHAQRQTNVTAKPD